VVTPPALQRAALDAPARSDVPPIVHDVLVAPGQPLDAATRADLEPRLGQDFSRVRVHADGVAAASARAVDARAYTVGRDVVFGAGQYAPSTHAGQQLLAHELTHVVQQGGVDARASQSLTLGAANDPIEREADRVVAGLTQPGVDHAPSRGHPPVVRRQGVTTAPGPGLGLGLGSSLSPSINLPTESIELEGGESLSTQNPKLVRVAQNFKSLQAGNPDAYVKLSAYLTEAAQNSSAQAATERSQLSQRMSQARDTLQALGVPRDQVSLEPATAFSTSARGQVSVDVYKARSARPFILGPTPTPNPLLGPQPQPQPSPSLPSLSDKLTLKYGPLTVELPKSAALKLPVRISAAKSLVIDLKAAVPGDFSLSITLDGLPHVRIALKAGAKYDKDKGASGSAGLQIEMTKTVCSAANPEELKAKIIKAGADLTKAMQEFSAESDNEKKLLKVADIASPLADMYDAVDKSKAACKQVPAATFEFGAKGPLGGDPGSDPSKREPGYIGGTITIPF